MSMKSFFDEDDIQKKIHRAKSAAVVFQKGIYHLFMLSTHRFSDAFDRGLRLYQCAFSARLTQMLLDFDGLKFEEIKLSKVAKKRGEKDPSTIINHTLAKDWNGFSSDHPLHEVSQDTKRIYDNVEEARHNLIYRPYYEYWEDSGSTFYYWEDCTLENLFMKWPKQNELEESYRKIYDSIKKWSADKNVKHSGFISHFIFNVWDNFKYESTHPPATLVLCYARLLSLASELDLELLNDVKLYRDKLLGTDIKEELLIDAFNDS